MKILIVVENPKLWPLDIPGTEVVQAKDYLTDRRFVTLRRAKVFNLCRTYGYQTVGYYVSLLAAARGHKPLPDVTTIQDLRLSPLVRIVSEELEDQIQKVLAPIKSARFTLSIYFGRNLAKRYDRLCQLLFNHFSDPLLRAEFIFKNATWQMSNLRHIAVGEVPETHRDFLVAQAQRYFARPARSDPKRPRYDLAILYDSEEVDSPSDERAIKRFIKAGKPFNMSVSIIGKEDFGRIAEFDALFIRQTTYVNHHTYRFASRAQAEGLVVIDDPESIVRCTNKVYQAELFDRNNIPCPRTLVVHPDNAHIVGETLGFPCVLKRPDSSFSAGVVKAKDPEELKAHLTAFFDKSELVVAQAFQPSDFDWRVGVLGGRALYLCKYYMAAGHWQIQKAYGSSVRRYGKVETLAIQDGPEGVVALGVRASNLIGQGLYGVDIKEINGKYFVMEINDNPSIEAGCEDAVLKDALYDELMGYFYERLNQHESPMEAGH